MNAPVVTSHVRYLYPGLLFPEESTRPVSDRDPERAAAEAPESVFAFSFYDVATMTVSIGGQDVELRSGALNPSKRFYIDAEPMTLAEVEALPGDHRILLANMRGNGWDTVLRCRTGNFQPLEPGDAVVASGTAVAP